MSKAVTIAGATKYIPTSKDEDWSRHFHDWASAASARVQTAYQRTDDKQVDIAHAGGALAVNPALGAVFRITLSGNITSCTVAAGVEGQRLTLVFIQATSGKVFSGYPTNVLFKGGAFQLEELENEVEVLAFRWSVGLGKWVETSRVSDCRLIE